MSNDIFGFLFNLQDYRLKQLGNPLPELEKAVDWESFRSLLNKVHEKQRKHQAGNAQQT